MVMLLDAERNLRIVISRSIRILLPSQRKNHSGIFFPHSRKLITPALARDFDARPLTPKVQPGRSFNHLVDVSSTHARRAFKKIKTSIFMSLDELRVRDPAQ